MECVIYKAPASAADDKHKSAAPAGIAQAISGYQDSNLVWEDINFIRVRNVVSRTYM